MDQYIGKMLDNRYEILQCIGTGGMAVVYKARCHRLNRLVAIKILKSDLAQDAEFRRRFTAESQAVAQLSHPNIVSVYDVSRGGDLEYIVMELIDGITLKQYMERRGQLNWRESLHFITQIMRGLGHAHSRGIIHRDIKPQNIMVLRDGSVKVADFGIACLADSAQTLTQEALGSVHYISPEQAKGERPDARSDIYSSGVVLYEMLTGRLPFEGESAVSVAIQHLSAIPLSPREINPEIPAALELMCMKAMAPDLNQRYQSAADMIEDLETFRKNPEVEMKFGMDDLRPEEVDEPTRPIRRTPEHRTAAPASRTAEGRRHPPRRPPPSRRPRRDEEEGRRSSKGQVVLVLALIAAAAAVAAVLFNSILSSFTTPEVQQYVVPNVLGLTAEQARAREDVQGIFEIVETGEDHSEQYAAGEIFRQEPVAGEIRKGSQKVIQVWVSLGEETGQMPDVKNKTVQSALILLQKLQRQYELNIVNEEEYYQFSDEVTAEYIIDTIPAEGEPLAKGDTVILIVSKGPEVELVPVLPFVGMQIQQALGQMETCQLTCTEADVTYIASDKPAGTILTQSLEAGSQVEAWSTIRFEVSGGSSILPGGRETGGGTGGGTGGTGQGTKEKRLSIELPQTGKDTVQVDIYVGTRHFNFLGFTADGYLQCTVEGSGTQTVQIYFDGAFHHSEQVFFG